MKIQAHDKTAPSWDEKLKALLEAEAKKKNSRRLLLGVQTKDKRLNFRHAIGGEGIDISPKDSYFIASQTKIFTASIIFQLVDEEKIKLDSPISDYLHSELIAKIHVYKGVDNSCSIKVRELLHQTSGLSDYFLDKDPKTSKSLFDDLIAGEDPEWTLPDALDRIRQHQPKFAPSANAGKMSHYSDTNYQLLGAIIEAVTKTSLKVNLEERVFRPLELNDTYMYDYKEFEEPECTRQHPMLFYYKEKEVNLARAMSSFGADGGLVSTMDDMFVFLRAYFDGKLFDKTHLEQIQAQWNTVFAPPIQYGLGLMRFKIPKWMTLYCFDCPPLVGHSGANASYAFYAPDQEVFLVGTFNQMDQESRPYQFMLQVLDCLKK